MDWLTPEISALLITALTPVLVWGAKYLAPILLAQKWLIPGLASLLGGVLGIVDALAGSGGLHPALGFVLGLAGVGLREVLDQVKKAAGLTPLLPALLLAFALPALAARPAAALEATVTGATVTITYDEPTAKADGAPLDDLAVVRLFYDVGAGEVQCAEVPASAPTGGGVGLSAPCSVPVAEGQEVDVAFFGYAYDVAGNRSDRSEVVIRRIDRLAPAPIS